MVLIPGIFSAILLAITSGVIEYQHYLSIFIPLSNLENKNHLFFTNFCNSNGILF